MTQSPYETVYEVRRTYCPPGTPEGVWPPITDADCVYICNEVCWRLNGERADGAWGLLRNPGHTNWSGYSLDICARRDTHEIFDCLFACPVNVNDPNNSSAPAWIVPSTPTYQPPQSWAPVVLEWLPGPTPPDPPEPPTDLEARVAALERQVAAHDRRFAAIADAAEG